jgi:hypothetical protein
MERTALPPFIRRHPARYALVFRNPGKAEPEPGKN